MINKEILYKTIDEASEYKTVMYAYDEYTYISVSVSNDNFGELKSLTIGKQELYRQMQIIPHHVTAGFSDDNNIEITITFDTPIFLDEKKAINELFDYYQTMENFLNAHQNELWQIE